MELNTEYKPHITSLSIYKHIRKFVSTGGLP